jgi:hypothetical protein
MPSDRTPYAKNLVALGAKRLAELLLEVTAGDAAAKRRLRLELASRGDGDVASQIGKRLFSIFRSRSLVGRRMVKELGRDLEAQREAIAAMSQKEPARGARPSLAHTGDGAVHLRTVR